MNLKSLKIYRDGRGHLFVFTIVRSPNCTIAEIDPERFESLDALQGSLPALIEARLAASHIKWDISGDEENSDRFLKTVNRKSWNAFYRECTLVSINKGEKGYSLVAGHWDGRGFDSNPEDRTVFAPDASTKEVAESLVGVLKGIEQNK